MSCLALKAIISIISTKRKKKLYCTRWWRIIMSTWFSKFSNVSLLLNS